MTLRKTAVLIAAIAMMTGILAEAQVRPGAPPPPFPGRVPPRPAPFPGPRPMPPPQQREQQITRSIFVNRVVMNETLALRDLAGLGREFDSAVLESVQIDLRSRGNSRTLVELVVNNRVEDSVFNPQMSGVLRPRSQAQLGFDQYGLRLVVHDQLFIDRISVTVRTISTGPMPPPLPPAQQINVPIQINAQMRGNSRIDLAGYLNLSHYSGYRLDAVIVEATASWNNALLDLQVNSFVKGTMIFDRRNTVQSVNLQGAIIGAGADSLVLASRGDLLVRTVTLRLSH